MTINIDKSNFAICTENLSKMYRLYTNPIDRLKESLNPFRRQYYNEFYALQNINLVIRRGESVGIVGKNGSGKSTLLKMLTGVLTPSSGNVKINGKVSALLELGAGFNLELTGIENIYFNGMLMGFSKSEIDEKIDSILTFADIGEYAHQKVKTYSSGMFVRLAFSVASNVSPDILIIDEALSVGDIFFQQKCYKKINDMINSETTLLFVSHDTAAIMSLCKKAIVLNSGHIIYEGEPYEAISRYHTINEYAQIGDTNSELACNSINSSEACSKSESEVGEQIKASIAGIMNRNILNSNGSRHGEKGVEILGVRIIDIDGHDNLQVEIFKSLKFCILIKASRYTTNLMTGIHLYDRFGSLVFASSTYQLGCKMPSMNVDELLIVHFDLTFSVQPGEYIFSLGVAEKAGDFDKIGKLHDRHEMLGPIVVVADQCQELPFYGIAQLPMNCSCDKLFNIR